jgi:metallo-beta-lactamase family protein
MLPDPKNTVILVGYQAQGSRGRLLADGVTELKIHGELVPVRAHISQVESFSVHADSDELIAWLKQAKKPKHAFVVHGEIQGQEHIQNRLISELGWNAIIPKSSQVFTV